MSCPLDPENDSFLISKQEDKSCFKDIFQPNLYNLQFVNAAKKVTFTACHSGKLQLACTSPQVISTSPKTLFD